MKYSAVLTCSVMVGSGVLAWEGDSRPATVWTVPSGSLSTQLSSLYSSSSSSSSSSSTGLAAGPSVLQVSYWETDLGLQSYHLSLQAVSSPQWRSPSPFSLSMCRC